MFSVSPGRSTDHARLFASKLNNQLMNGEVHENQISALLLNKFLVFYGTRRAHDPVDRSLSLAPILNPLSILAHETFTDTYRVVLSLP
jgi:hypothetical protein